MPERPVCWQCGQQMVRREPTHGVPYWACPTIHDTPAVAPVACDIDYATALVSSQITAPVEGNEFDRFDAEASPDPADFVGALCARLELCHASDQERERERVANTAASTTPTAAGDQGRLDRWAD